MDLAPSLPAWTAVCQRLDEFDSALAMHDADPAASRDPRAWVANRALLLLLLGRPDEARVDLARHGIDQLAEREPLTSQALVTASCRSALGDDAAYERLRAIGTSSGWESTYALGAAAEIRGDRAVADEAWTDAVERHGILTEFGYARWASAKLSARSEGSADDLVKTLFQVARACNGLPHDLVIAPEPVLAVVQRLLAMDDVAGARLFLHAVDRLQPASSRVQAEVKRLTPDLRRYRYAGAALLVLAVVSLPLGLAGLAAVGGWLWRRAGKIPGLNRPKSRAWRAVASHRHSPVPDTDRGLSGALLAAVAGATLAVSLGIAALLGAVWRPFLGDSAVPLWLMLASTTGGFTAIVGWAALTALRQRSQRHERLGRRAHRQRQAASLAHCQCLRSELYTDELAHAYAQQHLQRATGVRGRQHLPPDTEVFSCPNTAVLWLSHDLGPDAPGLLLRGAVPVVLQPDTQMRVAVGAYL